MLHQTLFTVLITACLSVQADPLASTMADEYQTLINHEEYSRAAHLADQMTLMEPDSERARFYLLYACKKAGEPIPDGITLKWPTNESSAYYDQLAADFGLQTH
ncbi:MAG: hypothetical protein CMI08_18985 [Oceanospirillaceae bacterium]|uniref:hypothetical protein n=1 Tax=unclassified Thalassolituus TaxID=2624967 RepID=UPI000C49B8D8|nr:MULTISPECIES: hypothetical protein [unclassified Thalassolituus]MAY01250.1 hypothetical protein [Oceanospirillaceae bacterium]MBS53583.1 hypothetical protein [Oceanospirillaceae bacterium]|tara:strand:+ start:1248 stop:1559 length:312 start_codon:yes stop_codon:yes gene_type:complete